MGWYNIEREELERVIYNSLNKQKNKKMEFSKKLALTITLLFIMTWFMAWTSWFIKNEVPEALLNYISVQFGVVVTGYFAKSGYENSTKIKNTNETVNRVVEDNR